MSEGQRMPFIHCGAMHVRVSVHAGACPCADAQAGVLLPRDRHGYEVPANHLTPMSPGAAAPCILSGW